MSLWQIGSLTCDTFPFEVGETAHKVTADFAKHDLIAAPRDYEPGGPGDETLTVSGQILPFHLGGLSEIELAKQMCRSLEPQFVMRGDGRVGGWYVLTSVDDRGKQIGPGGVGFVHLHEIEMERVPDPGESAGVGMIGALLSLFG